MHFSKTTIVSFGLLATSKLVAGHAAIVGATGDQGGNGAAIGVDPATPRDGTRRNPFQQDSTRFRGDAADQCGETLGGGDNDVETGTAQSMAINGNTLPQVSQGGELSMTLHQVNGDGAGPYTCMIDSTGTGTQWTPIQVTQNVDGNARGRNNDQQMQELPLNVAIPADQQCTGTVAGQENVCMVRCENPARAGPFGGCVPIQMAGAANNNAANGNAANGNANNAANGNANNAANGNANNAANGNANNAANGNQVNDNNNANNANTGNNVNDNLNNGNNVNDNLNNGNTGNVNDNLNNGNNVNTGNTGNNVNDNLNNANTGNAGNNLNDNLNNANNGNAGNNLNDNLNNANNANQVNDNTGINGNVPANNGNVNTGNAGNTGNTGNIPQNTNGNFQKRQYKQLTEGGPIVTDDDQEEEVELLEEDLAKRWFA